MKALSLEERLFWVKSNHSEESFNRLKMDLYSFSFNHPLYGGYNDMNNDKMRHSILDDLDIPRFKQD